MSIGAADIERAVREVLDEMGIAVVSGSGETPALPGSHGSTPPRDQLAVPGRLVTLSELDGKLADTRRVVVRPDAVVTPAVRDELRRRGIELVRSTPSGDGGDGAVATVALRVVSVRWDDQPLVAMLRRDGLAVEVARSDCLIDSTDALAERLRSGGVVGVLLSTHPAMALCLANRHDGVRAIAGRERGQMQADTLDVGANLLIVDQSAAPAFALKQMIVEFARTAPRPCPDELRERLG